MTKIELIKEVKRVTWKAPFCFPGGYELRVIMADGEVLCRQCCRDNWSSIVASTLHGDRDGWAVAGVDVLWEGPANTCPHCNVKLPTEYGDPDAEEVA